MKRNTKSSGGFIQIIILIIIVLVVASLYGYGPEYIWNEYLSKIFIFIWNVIVAIVNFVVNVIKKAAEISNILNWFKN
ncbi:MAG TPA: hypothetical protein PJ997_00105 [Candidatus Paceibacterota bacterium]|nr:hypothetical protein [Candidatus Paceibacterota bacterium]HMP18733.1 hypothetical protein [Candidatus Paceibacterota bacterium]HMP85260.1 hypothetical protein [Candidatus Paceibacterota bacterium]